MKNWRKWTEQISLCLNKVILEAINELVHLELLTDSEFAVNVNFLALRNLASNELFLYENKEAIMVLKTVGVAGTLESSDAMITVEPANQGGIVIDVSSSVKRQFGRQIEETVLNTIKELGVENANVKVVDKGALNYALIARTKAAVYRAAESHDYKF